ncbi:MAG: hypothetical protein ACYCQJ_13915 [Nitrososphaerales archaeon]
MFEDGSIRFWNPQVNFEDFFDPSKTAHVESFFVGAKAHHWHNQWDVQKIAPGCVAEKILRQALSKLGDNVSSPLLD